MIKIFEKENINEGVISDFINKLKAKFTGKRYDPNTDSYEDFAKGGSMHQHDDTDYGEPEPDGYEYETDPIEQKQREWKANPSSCIEDIVAEVYNDFCTAPYHDKMSLTDTNYGQRFKYILENKGVIYFTLVRNGRIKIIHEYYGVEATATSVKTKEIVNFLNFINRASIARPGSRPKKNVVVKKNVDHPRRPLYDTLKNTYNLRIDQLAKMMPSPEKDQLENELSTVKSKIDDMKNKYQFEHLKTFEQYHNK